MPSLHKSSKDGVWRVQGDNGQMSGSFAKPVPPTAAGEETRIVPPHFPDNPHTTGNVDEAYEVYASHVAADLWTCPRCTKDAGNRGYDTHYCRAENLLHLSPGTEKVLEACREAGGEPLIVGGAVRDALLSENTDFDVSSKDIDIEVYGVTAENLSESLRKTGAKVDEVGVSFGVLKVVLDEEEFDVSLPRLEKKTGSGHRGFTIIPDHELEHRIAFARRDYTINAIGWDPETGNLIDSHGGLADLDAKVLRHTSEAFAEDPLRVLRGLGFVSRLDFDMAPETIAECRKLVDTYPELATERVWTEWEKIAARGTVPSKALHLLHETGWEQHYPELSSLRDVPQDPAHHPEGTVDVHTALVADAAARIADRDNLDYQERTILVLASICHDLGKSTHTQHQEDGRITSHGHASASAEAAKEFLTRIGAPQTVREHVAVLAYEHMTATTSGTPTPAAVRRLSRRLAGPKGNGPSLNQWARVVEADNAGRGPGSKSSPAQAWLDVAEKLPAQGAPRPSVLRGEHLMSRGLKPGPEFAPILAAALHAQDEGIFHDEEGALAWLDSYLITETN